jgi:hypothetical protein
MFVGVRGRLRCGMCDGIADAAKRTAKGEGEGSQHEPSLVPSFRFHAYLSAKKADFMHAVSVTRMRRRPDFSRTLLGM